MKYCVIRPFGASGELHVSNSEFAVAVRRDTEPTPVGAINRVWVNLYTRTICILTTLGRSCGFPGTISTACSVTGHNSVEIGCKEA